MTDGGGPSSSRYRAGGDKTVPQHTNDLQPAAVIMTHEIHATTNREWNRRMVNHYEFDHRVGVGQHGEVYLARDTRKNNMLVVRSIRPVQLLHLLSTGFPCTCAHYAGLESCETQEPQGG